MDNFTAADAWSGNFAGQYFAAPQKEQIAKWLFSQKLGADGNPKESDCRCENKYWRGHPEQDGADIQPYQRQAESFLTKDGKHYDWGKCSRQQYFMRKAKEYGCDKFLAVFKHPARSVD
ncbi:MAG: glycoside hydrolase [Bacilli bacterium]